jgi:hypothetical protein
MLIIDDAPAWRLSANMAGVRHVRDDTGFRDDRAY